MRSILNGSKYPIYLSLSTDGPAGHNFINFFKKVKPGASFTYKEVGLVTLTIYKGISDMKGVTFCINEDVTVKRDENNKIMVDKPLKGGTCSANWSDGTYVILSYIILFFILFCLINCMENGRPNPVITAFLIILMVCMYIGL